MKEGNVKSDINYGKNIHLVNPPIGTEPQDTSKVLVLARTS